LRNSGWIAAGAELVFPIDRATEATPDPFDEMVLACTLVCRADLIVSGDKKHPLSVGQYRGIPFLGPTDFLKRIA